jgi:4-hydroxy-tetrahydrodipicolinate synthase
MRGLWTALITPFTQDNKIDIPAFKKILLDQQQAGVTGVVLCGTTGEAPTLSLSEQKQLVHTAQETLSGSSMQIIMGTGTNCTEDSISLSKWASEQKLDGILVVVPYYNRPSQQGLQTHFLKIADAVSCEVILYNVPSRSGTGLTIDTLCRLAQHPQINTLKETSGNISFVNDLLDKLRETQQTLDVLSGDDPLYLPLAALGIVGLISVASNVLPRVLVQLHQALQNGCYVEAQELHTRYYPLFRDLFIESNPAPIKTAMSQMGWCQPYLRLPLAPLLANHQHQLDSSLKKCGLSRGVPT